MRNFFLFSVLYGLIAVIILSSFRENPAIQLFDAYIRTRDTLSALINYLPYFLAGLAALFLVTRQFGGKDMLRQAIWALCGCLIFSAAFTLIKTAIPFINPFFADPWLARVDFALHGGNDPWGWTHKFADWLPSDAVSTLYFVIWGFPAAFFPLILALSDNDTARKKRFLILHCAVWIGLGNVVAILASSVGPVYYDRLLETERFPQLLVALRESGISGAHIGVVQDGLWRVYVEHGQIMGSGISAFPSVHNGVATLTMLYLMERSRWLAPIGVLFCAAILFASVYIGWHYAIDGYFSIIAVTGFWAAQRKWDSLRRRNVAIPATAPA